MYLYHLTLQPPTTIPLITAGFFTDTPKPLLDNSPDPPQRLQELCMTRGSSYIDLYQTDSNTGKLVLLASVNTFSVIRALCVVRPIGYDKDFLAVGSDSGKFILLEYDAQKRCWNRIQDETLGRSGSRRSVASQYLASDPKGRAVMIGAIDHQRIVYTLRKEDSDESLGTIPDNEQEENQRVIQMAISSPLEIGATETVLFDVVALDRGFNNPIFACLETDYGDLDEYDDCEPQQQQKMSKPSISKTLGWYEVELGLNHVAKRGHVVVEQTAYRLVALPGLPEGPGGVLVFSDEQITWYGYSNATENKPTISISIPKDSRMITCHSILRVKKQFCVLFVDEQGDVFKLSLDYEGDSVNNLRIRYYDSVYPASGMTILKHGLMLISSEYSNEHVLYQIQDLGDRQDEVEVSSKDQPLVYTKHSVLLNIAVIDSLPNYAPNTDSTIINLGKEESPQLYTCQGRFPTSTLNIMRYGLQVSEIAVSSLPSKPTGIWTLKERYDSSFAAFIMISFEDSTLLLSVGESIEEISDSDFLLDHPTLGVFLMADSSVCQVHRRGIRVVRSAPSGSYVDYKIPSGTRVELCSANARQIVLYLDNRTLLLYELDMTGGSIREQFISSILPEDVCSMYVGPLPEGRQRTHFLAIGCTDDAIRILSLYPENYFEVLGIQALTSRPSSLLINKTEGVDSLFVGLEDGIYIRLVIDNIGSMTDPRSRLLGNEPVYTSNIQTNSEAAVLATSTRTWINYTRHGRLQMVPLFYESLQLATLFDSEQFPSAIVGSVGSSLRIVSIDNLDTPFNRHVISVPLMIRKLLYQEHLLKFLVLQSEYLNGQWNSMIQLFDPFDGTFKQLIDIPIGIALTCATFCTFWSNPDESFLVLGLCHDYSMVPRKAKSSHITLYKYSKSQDSYEVVHQTEVEDIPSVMVAFDGRLLVSVGSFFRLYDLGKKRLLRKCEIHLPVHATSIQSQGRRLYVTGAQESIFCLLYTPDQNRFFLFADDAIPRMCTSMLVLDHDTIAVADKFGGFCILRIPANISEDIDMDPTASRLSEKELLHGAPNKLERLCEFWIGDVITSMHHLTWTKGMQSVILYTTISGLIGVFIPLPNQSTALLVQNLELALRNPTNPITSTTVRITTTAIDLASDRSSHLFPTARDHLRYRSMHIPIKNVIDGDLCEEYCGSLRIDDEWKKDIADGLEKDVQEIIRKVQDLKASIGF